MIIRPGLFMTGSVGTGEGGGSSVDYSLYNIAQAPSAWGISNFGTKSLNASVAPDGTTTATNLVESSTSGQHGFSLGSYSFATKTNYRMIVEAKMGTRRYVRIGLGVPPGTVGELTYFDLQNGTVVSPAGTLVRSSITSLTSGWYRCEIVLAVGTTTNSFFSSGAFIHASNDGSSVSIAGVNGNTSFSIGKVYIAPDPETMPAPHLFITDTASVATKRSALITAIFGGGGLPSEIGTLSTVTNPISGMTDVAACDKITMTGYASRPRLFTPTTPNGSAVIVHQGHGGNANDYTTIRMDEQIQQLVTAGFTVVGMMMPGGADEDTSGNVASHAAVSLATHTGPVIVAVNTLIDLGYTDIHMTGVSGGGWATVMGAALDTRILKSFPVEGSFPIYMPFGRDTEQLLPGLGATATYLDLYIMGGSGAGRHQTQIFYSGSGSGGIGSFYYAKGPPYKTYLEAFAATVSSSWQMEIYTHSVHEFNTTMATALILPEIT